MYLDLSTTTLLAGLSHLLSSAPVRKVSVGDNVVSANITIDIRGSVGFDFVHIAFAAHG
jgi:hypothetical protein